MIPAQAGREKPGGMSSYELARAGPSSAAYVASLMANSAAATDRRWRSRRIERCDSLGILEDTERSKKPAPCGAG